MELNDQSVYIKENKKDAITMAICMLAEYPAMVRCEKEFFEYNGKCYDLIGEERLEQMFYDFCVKYGVTSIWNKRRDVMAAIRASSNVPSIEKMNDYNSLICVNNGILDIYTNELIPHSKDYYFDSTSSVDYDPLATECPSFMEYLNHTFNEDQDTIENVIRLGGYLIDNNVKAGKMFLFDGEGGSGKSTLIDTYSMFFNPKEVTGMSLDVLSEDSFKREKLIYSRLNFSAEAKKGYLEAEELKKIITGDLTEVQRKHLTSVSVRPKIKIIVACNGLMKFTDTSDGIFRRLCIIRFTNQYKTQREIERIQYAKERKIYLKDPELFDRITSEKSAILNLFLQGLLKLKENKYEFVDSADSALAMTEFRRDSDTVREFLEENYELDFKAETPLVNVYEHYRSWYRHNVQDTQGMKFRSAEMGRRIKEVFGVTSTGQRKLFNKTLEKYEHLSVYQLKLKTVLPPDDYFDDATPADHTQLDITPSNLGF